MAGEPESANARLRLAWHSKAGKATIHRNILGVACSMGRFTEVRGHRPEVRSGGWRSHLWGRRHLPSLSDAGSEPKHPAKDASTPRHQPHRGWRRSAPASAGRQAAPCRYNVTCGGPRVRPTFSQGLASVRPTASVARHMHTLRLHYASLHATYTTRHHSVKVPACDPPIASGSCTSICWMHCPCSSAATVWLSCTWRPPQCDRRADLDLVLLRHLAEGEALRDGVHVHLLALLLRISPSNRRTRLRPTQRLNATRWHTTPPARVVGTVGRATIGEGGGGQLCGQATMWPQLLHGCRGGLA